MSEPQNVEGLELPAELFNDEGKIKPPPWTIYGTTVDMTKNTERRLIQIVVPPSCMETMSDDQILALLTMTERLAAAFRRVLPGWKVLA